jgi:hypothetical protein
MDQVDKAYETKYGALPWIFSAATPLWDVEYADDTVILGRTSEVVTRFINILIEKAHLVGLSLNLHKCEHLAIHSSANISVQQPGLDSPYTIPKKDFVKYLGVLLMHNSGSNKEINRRLSQARASFKLLKPFFTHKHLTLKWKLTVYQQIIGAILTYAMESLALDVTHLRKLDSFHFKVIRQCLGVKSTFYTKVVNPTDEPSSNQYYHKLLSNRNLYTPTPSQKIQASALKLFGHITRHPEELPSKVTFASDGSFRRAKTTHRSGAPRLHWSELTMTLAHTRIDHFHTQYQPPPNYSLSHNWYSPITREKVSQILGSSIFDRYDNTTSHRLIQTMVNTDDWSRICV